jgi:hypothetical protein
MSSIRSVLLLFMFAGSLCTLKKSDTSSFRWPNSVLNSGILRQIDLEGRKWSRGRDLNSRPADYESAALPLSYLGP